MKKLLKKDNPILRQKAEVVSAEGFNSAWMKELVEDLFETMKTEGAVGVAAPQIGISKRVIVFSTAYTTRRQPSVQIPDTVLINPEMKVLSEHTESGYEGCLSVKAPDLVAEVVRASEIEYSGFDLAGNRICKRAIGLEARILQHEIDHLNGILFVDHVKSTDSFTTYEALKGKLS